jgi:PleD family two-component response regulator
VDNSRRYLDANPATCKLLGVDRASITKFRIDDFASPNRNLLRKRILFVDDEAGIRLTLPHILVKHGFEVTSVASVDEAVKEIKAHKFDASAEKAVEQQVAHPNYELATPTQRI